MMERKVARRRANVVAIKVIKKVVSNNSQPQLKPKLRNRVSHLRRAEVKRARKVKKEPMMRAMMASISVMCAMQSSQAATK